MGLSGPVSRRVDAATKAGLLRLIDEATAAGWPHRRACEYLELSEGRAWRWYERREAGRLEDHRSGAGAVHGLRADERDAIIALFDAWGEIDRSHRKLAHRGSYEQLVWSRRQLYGVFWLQTAFFCAARGGRGVRSAARSRSGRAMSATRSGSTTRRTSSAARRRR